MAITSYRPGLTRAAAVTVTALLVLLAPPAGRAGAAPATLPLGDPGLPETRTTQTLAAGVTLTRIIRGTEPAPPGQIDTTARGPWRVDVLTIDPHTAHGHVRATYGPDLAHTEKTTELVRSARASAGVNASFFTFTASAEYPGDPVGLGLYDGRLLSEPTGDTTEADFLVDAAHGDRARMGRMSWTGSLHNRRTGATLPLTHVNHPPVVPPACTGLPDPTQCSVPGDVVRLTPEFAGTTPVGAGVEVVLDRHGCVVRTRSSRGTHLVPGQTSVQATGVGAAALLHTAGGGCLRTDSALTDEQGRRVPVHPGLSGVTGRYRLTAHGRIVVPAGSGGFFARNPRTIAGTTRDGKVVLVTVDGRMTTSVGTTMDETAAVAHALGLTDAVNLDGGGSTTMSVEGTLVNHPSGPTERSVGDALVFVPGPYRPAGQGS
ncbi:phosphodiester glycosidase family protein [Streptomyces alanosinicus]|uniref:Phosphodiester glycosidase domain-containing protein n=1 Tax=Streptomyces alanosinicus TaxID=68171 RepID=A0A918YK62_9ACTN|nr:phosphodiester glycosidase family protein [Streptomyces alanosinicus]GHE05112.1 hypothetical protein GCM10010339_39550 [Streptomyces alanosinicus]